MPNWCDNIVTIELKNKNAIDNFLCILNDLNWFKKDHAKLDFNTYIPYPEKFKKMDEEAKKNSNIKDGYNSGGYEWCCINWGTKWNANDFEIINDMSEFGIIVFRITTAWAPPYPIFEKMSEKYPGIKIKINWNEESGGKGTQCFYIKMVK